MRAQTHIPSSAEVPYGEAERVSNAENQGHSYDTQGHLR